MKNIFILSLLIVCLQSWADDRLNFGVGNEKIHSTTHFDIHYATTGPHAINTSTINLTVLGTALESAYISLSAAGFSMPPIDEYPNFPGTYFGGNSKYDIYFRVATEVNPLDPLNAKGLNKPDNSFVFSCDPITSSYVLLNKDINPNTLESTGVHEFFHGVHKAYYKNPGISHPPTTKTMIEGHSTWSEPFVITGNTEYYEEFMKEFNFRSYLPFFYNNGGLYPYGSVFFWKFLEEQHRHAGCKENIIQEIWEERSHDQGGCQWLDEFKTIQNVLKDYSMNNNGRTCGCNDTYLKKDFLGNFQNFIIARLLIDETTQSEYNSYRSKYPEYTFNDGWNYWLEANSNSELSFLPSTGSIVINAPTYPCDCSDVGNFSAPSCDLGRIASNYHSIDKQNFKNFSIRISPIQPNTPGNCGKDYDNSSSSSNNIKEPHDFAAMLVKRAYCANYNTMVVDVQKETYKSSQGDIHIEVRDGNSYTDFDLIVYRCDDCSEHSTPYVQGANSYTTQLFQTDYLAKDKQGISYQITIVDIPETTPPTTFPNLYPCFPPSSRPSCTVSATKQSIVNIDNTPQTLSLYSLHGITIQHFTVNESKPLPKIQDLQYLDIPSGVYIVVTRNAEGQIIESKKMFIR